MGHCWFAMLVGIETGDERKESKYKYHRLVSVRIFGKDTMQHLNL